MLNQDNKNVYIFWSDGLQGLMNKMIVELRKINQDNQIKVYVLCLNPKRANEVSKLLEFETILLPNINFSYQQCSPGVQNVLTVYGASLGFSERHFYSSFDFLKSIYECDEDILVSADLIMRAAYFCTLMERNGGILISEYGSDIFSTMASLLQDNCSNFINITVQGARLFSENDDVFFNISSKYESPITLLNLSSKEDAEYIDRICQRTLSLLKSSITSESIYKNNPKNNIQGLAIKKYSNSNQVVFFPLQFFPENATLGDCIGAVDQIWVVNHLSRALPHDCELWVKDHFVLTEADGNRLDVLKKLPNVRIIPSAVSVAEILPSIDLLVTQSSSAGLEAIYRGIPVLCFGNPLYQTHPLVTHSNLLDLSVNQLRHLIMLSIKRKGMLDQGMSEKIMDEILENHAKFSYVSRASEGPFPYTDSVAKALIQAIVQTFKMSELDSRA